MHKEGSGGKLGLVTLKFLPLECKLVQPLWKTVRRFLKKLKIELPYDPEIPLLGIYPEKTLIQKDTCIPYVHSSTIYNSQDTETTQVPIKR